MDKICFISREAKLCFIADLCWEMTKNQSAASDPDLLPHLIAKTARWHQRVVIFACLAASSGLHRNQALDRKATAQACSQFVIGTTTTGKQLEFAALRLGFLLSKNCLSGSLTSLVNLCFIFSRLVKTCFNHVKSKDAIRGKLATNWLTFWKTDA